MKKIARVDRKEPMFHRIERSVGRSPEIGKDIGKSARSEKRIASFIDQALVGRRRNSASSTAIAKNGKSLDGRSDDARPSARGPKGVVIERGGRAVLRCRKRRYPDPL